MLGTGVYSDQLADLPPRGAGNQGGRALHMIYEAEIGVWCNSGPSQINDIE